MRTTQNIRDQIGRSISITWGVSRGRDSYGYTTCTLRNERGVKVAGCNGGGYDMTGTVIGNWLAYTFPNELRKLKEQDMPEHSHWQPERARVCDGKCKEEYLNKLSAAIEAAAEHPDEVKLADDCYECPTCKGNTRPSLDGKTVSTGRYFYGLKFYDPHYDVLDEKLDRCDDTFTKPEDVGKTFRQLKKEGKLVDLDILRRWYNNTSKFAFKRKNIPTIDGACGFSSVLTIANAIGITLRKVSDTKKLDVFVIERYKKSKFD